MYLTTKCIEEQIEELRELVLVAEGQRDSLARIVGKEFAKTKKPAPKAKAE